MAALREAGEAPGIIGSVVTEAGGERVGTSGRLAL
jgi:hypothetical protein